MDAKLLARAYDREAAGYDEKFREQQAPKIQRVFSMLPALPVGARVLDVGVGTGLLAAAWDREPVRFVGIDLSTAMLRIAQGRGVLGVRGDARRMPFASACFDAAVCVTGLVAAEDVSASLPGVARVLKSGSPLVLTLRTWDEPRTGAPFSVVSREIDGDEVLLHLRRA